MNPEMNCTEDAVRVGKSMSIDMVPVFQKLVEEHAEKSAALRKEKKWDEAMEVAVKGQYYREAIEVFNGTFNRGRF